MATESLIVLLDAKTQKLDAKLASTDEKLKQLEGQTKKNDKAFVEFGKAAVGVATAVTAAVTAAAVSAGNFAKELEIASNRFGTTVEEMQALSFASSTVGIELDKLGDIGKDVNEKIGEFAKTGGGGFQDFVDVMGLGADEAKKLALEFQTLSADQVLGRMVSQMEAAGISGNQMSFALEGLASDATDLLPLLKGNAEELNKLKNEFDGLGVTLTADQVKRLKEVNSAMKEMTSTMSNASSQLIAEYSTEIITAIEAMSQLGVKTLNAFNVIAVGWGNIVEISKAAISDLIDGTDTLAEVMEERAKISSQALLKMEEGTSRPLEIIVKKRIKSNEDETKGDKANQQQKLKNTRNYVNALSTINDAFLNENKAIKAALIVADTAAAVMLQLSSGDPYTAFGRAAVAAATGAAQLANLKSATRGGGNISADTSGGSAVSSTNTAQETPAPEIDVNVGDVSTGAAGTLKLVLEDGTEIAEGLLEGQSDAESNGRGDLF